MNEKFEEFINETKQRLLAYEMDASCFNDYGDKDIEMMKKLREVLYENIIKDIKQENINQELKETDIKDEVKGKSSPPETNRFLHFKFTDKDEIDKISLKDWNDVIDKIKELDTRLDKLEEKSKDKFRNATQEEKDIRNYDKTADEMFKELGYKRCASISWKWMKLSDENYHYVTYICIWVSRNKFAKWDEKEGGHKTYRFITEAEDIAIHKKIEELTNGRKT